jgi:uncharacterized membrane protein
MCIPQSVSFIVVIIGLYLGHISTAGTKTQAIRLLDMFLIGPLMIYFGHRAEASIFSILLTFFGATTITYNLKNYMHALHVSK